MSAAIAYFVVVAVLSAITFLAYGLDKRRAGRGGRRIAERTLHLLSLLGRMAWRAGWPAGVSP